MPIAEYGKALAIGGQIFCQPGAAKSVRQGIGGSWQCVLPL